MTKLLLASAALLVVAATPAVSAAQAAPRTGSDSCPPGSWFCAQAPQQQPAPAGQPIQTLKPLPAPDDSPEETDGSPPDETSAPTPPPPPRRRPVVRYVPPPPPPPRYRGDYASDAPEAPPPYEYRRPRGPISRPREWGLNLHAEGAMIGSGSQGNAGIAGGGVGLRFKPVRSFGLEADFDVAGGDHDYLGNHRNETAFMLNGLVFLNPRSRAQIYLLAGFGWSAAHVTCPSCTQDSASLDAHYDYFGGQAGAGLELRLTRVLAFNVDIRGFIRGRTDQLAQTQPEFDQPTGCSANPAAYPSCRTTNTSGGGLLTGGMTLYF
jgi:opacity protein-like surface antigen